jgi:hypothetical protein
MNQHIQGRGAVYLLNIRKKSKHSFARILICALLTPLTCFSLEFRAEENQAASVYNSKTALGELSSDKANVQKYKWLLEESGRFKQIGSSINLKEFGLAFSSSSSVDTLVTRYLNAFDMRIEVCNFYKKLQKNEVAKMPAEDFQKFQKLCDELKNSKKELMAKLQLKNASKKENKEKKQLAEDLALKSAGLSDKQINELRATGGDIDLDKLKKTLLKDGQSFANLAPDLHSALLNSLNEQQEKIKTNITSALENDEPGENISPSQLLLARSLFPDINRTSSPILSTAGNKDNLVAQLEKIQPNDQTTFEGEISNTSADIPLSAQAKSIVGAEDLETPELSEIAASEDYSPYVSVGPPTNLRHGNEEEAQLPTESPSRSLASNSSAASHEAPQNNEVEQSNDSLADTQPPAQPSPQAEPSNDQQPNLLSSNEEESTPTNTTETPSLTNNALSAANGAAGEATPGIGADTPADDPKATPSSTSNAVTNNNTEETPDNIFVSLGEDRVETTSFSTLDSLFGQNTVHAPTQSEPINPQIADARASGAFAGLNDGLLSFPSAPPLQSTPLPIANNYTPANFTVDIESGDIIDEGSNETIDSCEAAKKAIYYGGGIITLKSGGVALNVAKGMSRTDSIGHVQFEIDNVKKSFSQIYKILKHKGFHLDNGDCPYSMYELDEMKKHFDSVALRDEKTQEVSKEELAQIKAQPHSAERFDMQIIKDAEAMASSNSETCRKVEKVYNLAIKIGHASTKGITELQSSGIDENKAKQMILSDLDKNRKKRDRLIKELKDSGYATSGENCGYNMNRILRSQAYVDNLPVLNQHGRPVGNSTNDKARNIATNSEIPTPPVSDLSKCEYLGNFLNFAVSQVKSLKINPNSFTCQQLDQTGFGLINLKQAGIEYPAPGTKKDGTPENMTDYITQRVVGRAGSQMDHNNLASCLKKDQRVRKVISAQYAGDKRKDNVELLIDNQIQHSLIRHNLKGEPLLKDQEHLIDNKSIKHANGVLCTALNIQMCSGQFGICPSTISAKIPEDNDANNTYQSEFSMTAPYSPHPVGSSAGPTNTPATTAIPFSDKQPKTQGNAYSGTL